MEQNSQIRKIMDMIKEELDYFHDFLNITEFNVEKLTEAGMIFVAQSGILNRLFRRWYQIPWLKQDWTDTFSGTTPPRQLVLRIGKTDKKFQNADWFATHLLLEEEDGRWQYQRYFFPYSLRGPEEGLSPPLLFTSFPGIKRYLEKGIRIKKNGKLGSYYENEAWWDLIIWDRDFLPWMVELLYQGGLLEIKEFIKKGSTRKLFLNRKGKAYFELGAEDQLPLLLRQFFFTASEKIAREVTLEAIYENVVAKEMRNILQRHFIKAKNGWVSYDDFYEELWNLLRHYDSCLLEFGFMDEWKRYEKKDPLDLYHSKNIFFKLSRVLGIYFFHPLDRFLG